VVQKHVQSDWLEGASWNDYPDKSGLFQDDNAPIHSARGVTQWFDEHENDVSSHQISTQLNTYGRIWTDVLDSALHHHHQNQMREYLLEEWCSSLQKSSRDL